jgi:hypothetical protein
LFTRAVTVGPMCAGRYGGLRSQVTASRSHQRFGRRGGVNRQPHVELQRFEQPPRDSPLQNIPDTMSEGELNIQPDRGRLAFFLTQALSGRGQ